MGSSMGESSGITALGREGGSCEEGLMGVALCLQVLLLECALNLPPHRDLDHCRLLTSPCCNGTGWHQELLHAPLLPPPPRPGHAMMGGGHCRPPPPFSRTRFSPRRFCNRNDPPRAALNENHEFQPSALTVFRSRGISSFFVAAQGTAPICLSSEPRAGGEAAAPVVKAEMAAGAPMGAVPQQLELHIWMTGVHIWMARGRPGGPISLLVLVMGGTETTCPSRWLPHAKSWMAAAQ